MTQSNINKDQQNDNMNGATTKIQNNLESDNKNKFVNNNVPSHIPTIERAITILKLAIDPSIDKISTDAQEISIKSQIHKKILDLQDEVKSKINNFSSFLQQNIS